MHAFTKIVSPVCFAVAVMSAQPAWSQSADTSFFLTSNGVGNGANLGGLAGADNHCQRWRRRRVPAPPKPGAPISQRKPPTARPR